MIREGSRAEVFSKFLNSMETPAFDAAGASVALGVSVLRAELRALLADIAPEDPLSTTLGAAPAVSISTVVECARHRVIAAQTGLDALSGNLEAALVQLQANRDSATTAIHKGVFSGVDEADVLTVFAAGIAAVHTAAADKRTRLESELVVADAALSDAIDARAAVAEVGDIR